MINKLKADFKRIFERESEEVFFSPGRVNLIGEHTDYNGGHVFPCALSFGTYGVVAKRNDKNVRMYSLNFEDIGIVEFNLDSMEYNETHDWVNYPKGVAKVMPKMKDLLHLVCFHILIYQDHVLCYCLYLV